MNIGNKAKLMIAGGITALALTGAVAATAHNELTNVEYENCYASATWSEGQDERFYTVSHSIENDRRNRQESWSVDTEAEAVEAYRECLQGMRHR